MENNLIDICITKLINNPKTIVENIEKIPDDIKLQIIPRMFVEIKKFQNNLHKIDNLKYKLFKCKKNLDKVIGNVNTFFNKYFNIILRINNLFIYKN